MDTYVAPDECLASCSYGNLKDIRKLNMNTIYKRSIIVCLAVMAIAPTRMSGQVRTKAQEYVEAKARCPQLKDALVGVLAMTKGGDTLAAWNPSRRMLPASNMKLVTTGSALHGLGPDFRFETRIAYSGNVVDGVLDGDLYIIGGGDPTIASKDSIAVPRYMLMGKWKAMLDKAGIKKIKGDVIGDGRYFDGPIEKDSWSYQDLGTYYGPGGDGLCFYENAQDFSVSPGPSVGSGVKVSVKFPSTPWMRYSFPCKTAEAGTGDKLYYYTSDIYPYGEIRGTFAIDRAARTEEFSNKYGAYTCAYYFRNYLMTHGVEVCGGAADVRNGRVRTNLRSPEPGPYAARVDGLEVLGSTYSPELWKIAKEANHKSDNFYAETLLRIMGRRFRHSASYDSSYVALNDVFARLGVDASRVRISDGSGLSRHNYVSPEFFVSFLRAMMDSPVFEDFVKGLPQPGQGTLSSRLKGKSEALKSRVYMKSGSMDGVLCYSGYIVPEEGCKDDSIAFSILTNNSTCPLREIGVIIDGFIASLAEE